MSLNLVPAGDHDPPRIYSYRSADRRVLISRDGRRNWRGHLDGRLVASEPTKGDVLDRIGNELALDEIRRRLLACVGVRLVTATATPGLADDYWDCPSGTAVRLEFEDGTVFEVTYFG